MTTNPNKPGRPRVGRAGSADAHVAGRIRERRRALGITQQELAAELGVTYQQLHKYETGVNRVAAGRLHQIARALHVCPGHFFEGMDGVPTRPLDEAALAVGRALRDRPELLEALGALAREQQQGEAA